MCIHLGNYKKVLKQSCGTDLPNRRTRCWKVTVPHAQKDLMKESSLYPSGWTHRRYFEPRTANKARTAAVPGVPGAAAVPGESVTARVTAAMTAAGVTAACVTSAGVTSAGVTAAVTAGATAGVTATAVSGEGVRSPPAATESQPGGFL